jgi:uncharacterized protein
MSKKTSEYIPRLLDNVVEDHLKAFGAIEIAGTMWSGKTRTSLEHASSNCNLDDFETRMLAETSPNTILAGQTPRVVDEWQLVPSVWDAVRRNVDNASSERGMYILTGSSRPAKESTAHSGAGRISRIRMWPMSLQESGDSSGKVSISDLFDGKFTPTQSTANLEDLAKLICRGGWPGALNLDDELALLVATQYVDAIVSAEDTNAPDSSATLELFLQSLARNIGSAPKIDTLAKDMGFQSDGKVSETGRRRIKALLDYFINRFVVDELHGWDAPIKSPQRLRTKPRYDFADPSIPAAILGVDSTSIMNNMQLFGQLFEQMCMRDLRVYSSSMANAKRDSLKYYRDADGLEVDAIIELRDGRWAGIEIKLGVNKVEIAEKNLLRLKKKIALNSAARNPEPSFLMVLVGAGKYAYKTENDIYVVPACCLGA